MTNVLRLVFVCLGLWGSPILCSQGALFALVSLKVSRAGPKCTIWRCLGRMHRQWDVDALFCEWTGKDARLGTWVDQSGG